MATTAGDIMQSQVVTVAPDDPLDSVRRLFLDEGIHGAPVVDEELRVLGMLTSTDLLRAAIEDEDAARSAPVNFGDEDGFVPSVWLEEFEDRLRERIAVDVMTDGVFSVPATASISEVARTLRSNKVHRVLVVEEGILRGIISSFDLVALLEESA